MFDEATSEAEDSSIDEASDVELPQLRIPSELGNDVSYAPSIMLFGSAASDGEDGDDERRIRARKEYHVAVYVHYDDEEFIGLCGDISDGGLFVASSRILPRSSLVDLEFLMPDSHDEFILEAEVRWVRERDDDNDTVAPGFGVRFLDVSDTDRAVLDRVIAAAEEGSEDP
jgi:uncharacterized protein (TIGR02266 family)